MNKTELVIVKEEAHLHDSRQKMFRFDQGEPISVRLLRMGRKHGLSIIVTDQVPSELPPAILGNISTRIVFRLINSHCVRAIAQTMGLDNGQVEELVELPRRRAIVQTAGTPKPLLINVVEIPERYRPPVVELLERENASLKLLDYGFDDVDVTEVLLGKDKDKVEIKTIRGDLHNPFSHKHLR